MKNQDDGVDVVSDSIVITDPYINGPLIDALRSIIEQRFIWGDQKRFAERVFKNPPFIKMGNYVSRPGRDVVSPWIKVLNELHQGEHPIYLSEEDSKDRPSVVMERIMQLAPDDMLLYCVTLAYFYATSFEKAVTFLSEVSNIWTLKPFEERFFDSMETHLDVPFLNHVEDTMIYLAPALAVGLVEIKNS